MRLIDADELKKELDKTCDFQDLYLPYVFEDIIDNAPTADDWQKYSYELWKNAYERGKADAYEQAKQKVTVSVKVGNETVETIEISGDAVRWSSSSL